MSQRLKKEEPAEPLNKRQDEVVQEMVRGADRGAALPITTSSSDK